jgi:hypothetical protein
LRIDDFTYRKISISLKTRADGLVTQVVCLQSSDWRWQHLLKTDRRASTAFACGIERFEFSLKKRPRRYRCDLTKVAINVASDAFSRRTQGHRSLVAEEFATTPFQSLLFILGVLFAWNG